MNRIGKRLTAGAAEELDLLSRGNLVVSGCAKREALGKTESLLTFDRDIRPQAFVVGETPRPFRPIGARIS